MTTSVSLMGQCVLLMRVLSVKHVCMKSHKVVHFTTCSCPVVLQQLGHTSVSSTRKLANGSVMCRGVSASNCLHTHTLTHTHTHTHTHIHTGKWNNLFTAVLSVTNQSNEGVAAREVYGEHLSKGM